ncbi:MAG: glutamine--fructose-6-phosphate transaminase (isomerizing), partial [Beijerinckiaceae bacterium]
EMLQAKGCVFESQTDTEVVAHLVTEEMRAGKGPVDAVGAVLPQLRGAFALAFLFNGQENLLIGARKGSPLAVGHGDGEMYLGSDALALAPFTNRVTYLEEGDWAILSRTSVEYRDDSGKRVRREAQLVQPGAFLVDKGNHRHFMAKEIHEQPEVISHTLSNYLDMVNGKVRMPASMPFDFRKLQKITITACGTAYYAGLVAKYWFEKFARLPVEIDVASEFRYREVPMSSDGLMIVVSQSGETADTLASLRYAKEQGQHIMAVVNVPTSTIARESDVVMQTIAGPEIGVASTKAFTCQLATLACIAVAAGRARGYISQEAEKRLVDALMSIPGLMSKVIMREHAIEALARDLSKATDVLYLGRGTNFPLALEGALKLKEISYIHAEGYAAGEL